MADYRRHYDEGSRHDRDWSDRAGDEVRSWFGDEQAGQRRGNDERDDRYPYGGNREDRSSRWEGPGSHRTDDRVYHNRYRQSAHYRDEGHPSRDREYRYEPYPRYSRDDAAEEYYRAAREQRDEFQRYEAQSPGAEFASRERSGHWRRDEGYRGRGPKDYKRSDDRVREEICDYMTEDPALDASDIGVQVSNGVVTLSGTVTSREQKRRAEDVAERVSGVTDVTNQLRVSREGNGHAHTAAQPVSQAYGTETPSKSSGTST